MRSRVAAIVASCALAGALGARTIAAHGAVPSGNGPGLTRQVLRVRGAADVLMLPAQAHAIAVVVHGGEIAHDRVRAAHATRVAARVYANRLRALRIGVLAVDYRWSGYGGGELRDIQAALVRVASNPVTAHLPRILIGGSHGGYLAALAAATLPAGAPRVSAVVDLYGFSSLGRTVAAPSSRYDRQARLTLRELGPPARNPSAYAARSPLSLAGKLKVPVFQAVGSRDRATLPDVLALQRALRLRGRAAVLLTIPGSTHGFAFGSAASPLVWRGVASFLRNLGLAA